MANKSYQVITDRVIKMLEEGTVPWRRSWGGKWNHPRNAISGNCYRGLNVFLLGFQNYASPYWLTYRQAQQLGGHVRKGEKSTPCIFWRLWEREDTKTGAVDSLPVLRHYALFHVSQCELPAEKIPAHPEPPRREFNPIEEADAIARNYADSPRVSNAFDRAFYRPSDDLVGMPAPEWFNSDEAYYSTLFHELTHSTGHSSRLARKGVSDGVAEFGSDPYGREELIAEMGAAFLCGQAGIEMATLDDSAAYLNGWLKVLKQDAKLVVQAAAAAQKAADWILGEAKAKPEAKVEPVAAAA